ncbi:MAG: hypothetical protein IKZ99_07460 [Salinivirgaceae bacterium]|nr:hypothetical protein [Salinivirgaceae bacterium]
MLKKILSMALLAVTATMFVACLGDDLFDDTPDTSVDGFVDLGLKSGTLWATYNVGATSPQGYGNRYAWGETQIKSEYEWNTYKYCKGSYTTLTKYCNNSKYGNGGFTDALTSLKTADDVVKVEFGYKYSMPTAADWEELCDQCYWVWELSYNKRNISGYIVYKAKTKNDRGAKVYNVGVASKSYSLSDAHIFLPAAGEQVGDDVVGVGIHGGYWSSSLSSSDPSCACKMTFKDNYVMVGEDSRYWGYSVRPVYHP